MNVPGLDVTEVVRSTAGKYLGGDVSSLSKEELVAKVKTLAAQDPGKADQMVGEVTDTIKTQSGGAMPGMADQLQDMVKRQLGI